MKKILIIEDDVELQKIYEEQLRANEFEVFHAHVGQQGLNMAKFHKPDLIMLDVMLPGGMNGLEVLEQLKRDKELKATPVLVLSSLDTEAKTAKSIGAVDYIVKTSISIEEIVDRIKKILT